MAANQLTTSGGTTVTALAGSGRDAIVSHLHGKYYQAAAEGRLFIGYTVIAGVALPTAAATLNSKFTLHNPASSGKVIEPVNFSMGIDSATTVVNGIIAAVQRNLSTTAGVPTSTTAVASSPLGLTGTAVGAVYSQATLTNVAIPGVTAATAVPIPAYPLFSFGAVTAAGVYPCSHDFDGRLLLGPDSLMAFCATVAPATAAFCAVMWAEWDA